MLFSWTGISSLPAVVSEADVLSALEFAHKEWQVILAAQEELRQKVGSAKKRVFTPAAVDPSFKADLESFLTPKVQAAFQVRKKQDRYEAFDVALKDASEKFVDSLTDKDLKADRSKLLGSSPWNKSRR